MRLMRIGREGALSIVIVELSYLKIVFYVRETKLLLVNSENKRDTSFFIFQKLIDERRLLKTREYFGTTQYTSGRKYRNANLKLACPDY